MTALALFVATFVPVFALGLQSLNVNKGQYAWAFFTSLVIGAMQMVMLKLGPDASWLETLGYLSGGPFGICAAMRLQPWLTRQRRQPPSPVCGRGGPRQGVTLRDLEVLDRVARKSPPPINRVHFKGDPKP